MDHINVPIIKKKSIEEKNAYNMLGYIVYILLKNNHMINITSSTIGQHKQ